MTSRPPRAFRAIPTPVPVQPDPSTQIVAAAEKLTMLAAEHNEDDPAAEDVPASHQDGKDSPKPNKEDPQKKQARPLSHLCP
ncbi:hypothetical protein BDK51DRAFT_43319 [Blyttiomyces helicus]|uniref:Uncharacterized protein n=1 Tax=Blyttiomyces helicus TaxID=388810 RepID=A0A4P9WEW7_9FUNG|nr:hypothetical protein BDK51DRAFT_43319 [Blyttiomyces helicus]|eukprot:RKO91271.1 hypothetical protein BDK51DRAFT_43319 [Blyttiomyces helicus]